jgi:hypothetical protein
VILSAEISIAQMALLQIKGYAQLEGPEESSPCAGTIEFGDGRFQNAVDTRLGARTRTFHSHHFRIVLVSRVKYGIASKVIGCASPR